MAGKLKDRTGEKGVNNEGYSMEIIAYRGNTDMDVLIDGKYLRTGCRYQRFQQGSINRERVDVSKRVGEITTSTEGYTLKLVNYRSAKDIDVLVDGVYLVKQTSYESFRHGRIKNPYHKGVYGVGYLGVGDYVCSVNSVTTAEYISWYGMFVRSYGKSYKARNPTYLECKVDERWHNFQDYAEWYNENYYTVDSDVMTLDKDILFKGNKLYSPDTCMFVPQRINSLTVNRKTRRGKYPLGVSKRDPKYTASIAKDCSQKNLGTFDTPEEAFHAYKTAKEAYIKQVADEYKDKIPQKLYDALYAYTIEITD